MWGMKGMIGDEGSKKLGMEVKKWNENAREKNIKYRIDGEDEWRETELG